jgi:hypothetical protein
MSKMRNRDGCAETAGKKADFLFVPQLPLQPHIKDVNASATLLLLRWIVFVPLDTLAASGLELGVIFLLS